MELESLKDLAKKYYPLAHNLIPEELMASQLIIDASCALLLSKEEEVTFEKENSFEEEFVRKLMSLASVRQQHFAHRDPGLFYKLEIKERVVLFLRDRLDVAPSKIASILNVHLQEVLSLLHNGRTKIVEGLGETMEGSI